MDANDLFREQFPAGLPFGKKKPSLALIPQQGSQKAYFESENEVAVIRENVYPNFTVQNLYSKLSGTQLAGRRLQSPLALLIALGDMVETESEKRFFRHYQQQFHMTNEDIPVLIPQAWIQWHSKPKTDLRAQASSYANDLYRVDFVAFWGGKRFAILIDDIGHYGKQTWRGWAADEEAYSARLKEDRKLIKEHWTVFRISNWEMRRDEFIPEILSDLRELMEF